jgi:Na+/melibiose symporter-like transporter
MDRRFSIYWLGQTLSSFGDAFALVSLPLLVLEATGSVTSMGLVTATGVAAQVVASFFAGTIVDRYDRRRTMILCDLGRAISYGFLPAMALLGRSSLWVIYLTVIVGGALSNLFSVGYMTAVPSLVSQDRLHTANARLQGSMALAYVLGSLCAGIIATTLGPVAAIAVDAGTFLISALSLAVIRFDTHAMPEGDAYQRFGAGLRFLLGHRLLRAMTLLLVLLGISGNIGVGAGITDLMIFHVKQELSLDAARVGTCVGITAFGALLGAVTAPTLARRFGSGTCFLAGNFVQAAGLSIIGFFPHLWAASGGGLLWGAGMMLRGVPMHSLRQSLIPSELLGRVTAISWIVIFGASAIGTAIITRVAAHLGAGMTMLGIGVTVALIGIAAWFTQVRER